MQTLTLQNDFGRELTMDELEMIAGGIDWGVVGAATLGGGLGGARLGAASANPWVIGGGAVLGAAIGGITAAAATWDH